MASTGLGGRASLTGSPEDITLSWVRRTRIGGELKDGTGTVRLARPAKPTRSTSSTAPLEPCSARSFRRARAPSIRACRRASNRLLVPATPGCPRALSSSAATDQRPPLVASEVLGKVLIPRPLLIPPDLAGAAVHVDAAPEDDFLIVMTRNETAVASITVHDDASASLATAANAPVTIAVGDVIRFLAPATPDVSVAGISLTIAARRLA